MSRSANTNFSYGAVLSLARLVAGVIRVKVVALALGIAGVGVFALAQQANATAISLVSMSLAVPIINLGRPSVIAGEYAEAGRIAGTAIAILLVNISLLIVLSILFGPGAGSELGLSPVLLWALVAATALGALAASFWEGLTYLSDRFDIYARAGIASAAADMLFIAGGAWVGGLRGAILALPIGPLVLIIAYATLLRRDRIARSVLRSLSVASRLLPQLLTYSAMMFAAVALTNVGLTAARAQVLLRSGAAANGGLQTATSLSAYLLAFVTTGFWGHMHARGAASGDTAEVRTELKAALERGLLIGFTGCGVAIVLADYLLPLFYSREFSAAAPLLIAYMPAEFCFQFLTLLISYQLTVSLRRRYLMWSLGYVALLVIVATSAVPLVGPIGYVAGHVAASVSMLAVAGYLCWRSGQIDTALLVRAIIMFLLLSGTSAVMFAGRGQFGAWLLVGLLPFLATGGIVAWRMAQGLGLVERPRRA